MRDSDAGPETTYTEQNEPLFIAKSCNRTGQVWGLSESTSPTDIRSFPSNICCHERQLEFVQKTESWAFSDALIRVPKGETWKWTHRFALFCFLLLQYRALKPMPLH